MCCCALSSIVGSMNTNKQNPYRANSTQGPVQQGGFVPARPAQPRHAANPYSANACDAARPSTQNTVDYSRANYGSNMGGGKHGRGGKHGGSGKSRVWTIILIVAAIVLAVSLGVLGVIGYGYWHGTKVYDGISATSGLAKEETALAAAIVGSGAWFLLELGKTSMWFGYALAVTLVTFYLLSSPPHNDTVMSVYMWASQAWLIAAPLCALAPAAFVRARPGRGARK